MEDKNTMEHVTEDCTCEGKVCTRCPGLKCVGHFTADKRLKSKLKSQCRDCQSAKNKKWSKDNREYNYERKKKWNEQNNQRINETRRQNYRKNPEKIKSKIKQYRQNNYDRVRAREKMFEVKNKEEIRERTRLYRMQPHIRDRYSQNFKSYYAQNIKYHKERGAQWRKENPRQHAIQQARRRTRKTQAGGSYTIQEWDILKVQYDYTCLCCGKREPEIQLTADHVIPVIKGGSSNIDNIQPLCKSCNSKKSSKIIDFRTKNT